MAISAATLAQPAPAPSNDLAQARLGLWAPSRIETLLSVAAIIALLPLFLRVAELDVGRDRRFAESIVAVQDLPGAMLPRLCRGVGAAAETPVREQLCGRTAGMSEQAPPSGLPVELTEAQQQAQQAFAAPMRAAQARLADLRARQREGLGDLRALSNETAALQAALQPFIRRYGLDSAQAAGPLALACAFELARTGLARPAAPADEIAQRTTRSNTLLLLAAALDGRGATAFLAGTAVLPLASGPPPRGCERESLATALPRAATLMADARQAASQAEKNDAIRALLRTAGWQWAAAMAIGLGLLKLARRSSVPPAGAAAALAAWSLAAWLARVPWPLAADRAFEPARVDPSLLSRPATFVLVLLILAGLLLLLALRRAGRTARMPQTLASRLGYPGFVLASGIGWLLLLDLSANAHPSNRYLALYHQGHLWLAMLVLSVAAFVRQPLGRALGWTLSIVDELAHTVGRRLGPKRSAAVLLLLTLALILAVGSALAAVPQLTSEIGRIWLIVSAAWFFFLRGGPLAERLAREPGSVRSLLRYAWPLLFAVLVLVGWMVVTGDMGPLLIAAYGAGAFVAASVGIWWHQRTAGRWAAFGLSLGCFALWIAFVTGALFGLGRLDDVTAARLESVATPLASSNDQLALVTWFQRATPSGGFGVGAVPWCGHAPVQGCPGVPAQVHSDYTFTAMIGTFGWTMAWVLALACAWWLHRLVRRHGRITRGEPRFVPVTGRVVVDDQAFVSWLCVAWVVLTLAQLAVTVAGNLAVLPLTGVTFPFMSYGMTSLLVNAAFLGLCLNVNLPVHHPHGQR